MASPGDGDNTQWKYDHLIDKLHPIRIVACGHVISLT